jgi:L-serine deaminase
MSKTRSEVLAESRKKGAVAGVAAVGAVALGVLAAPVAGVVAAVPAAYFGYKWWKHRSENGIKF